jgi:hypothetical protein
MRNLSKDPSGRSASPKNLYHYTSAEALLAILQSGSLWATDIRYLNDTAEYRFARDLLLKELQGRTVRLKNKRVRSLIEQHLKSLRISNAAYAYVTSFSACGNLLSQWRAYAPRDGVSIGFHAGALQKINGYALWKCHYFNSTPSLTEAEKNDLRLITDEVYGSIQWASRLMQQEARKSSHTGASLLEAQRDHAAVISASLTWAALKIKHAGFSEESEWRLIDNNSEINMIHAAGEDPQGLLNFRRGAFGITPYLLAVLPVTWKKDPLGIAEIIVGPSSNAAATVTSIKDLLRIKLRSAAPVVSCNIPYRTW